MTVTGEDSYRSPRMGSRGQLCGVDTPPPRFIWVPGIELPSPGLHSEHFAHRAVSPLHLACLLIESCAPLQNHHQAPTGCWLLSGWQGPPSETQTDPRYRCQRMKKATHTSEHLLGGSEPPGSHDNMTSPSTKLTLENHPS